MKSLPEAEPSEYTIAFFNSAAANSRSVYTYKAAGVGDGADAYCGDFGVFDD